MTVLRGKRLSKRTVDALPVRKKDAVFWDSELKGFGVRVYPTGSKVFVVQTRSRGKVKRVTLGAHGLITADQARRKAARTIARFKGLEDDLGIRLERWESELESDADPYDWSSGAGAANPILRRVLSGIVRRYDRSVMSNIHRATYAECLVGELLAPDWSPPWTRGYDRAPWDLQDRHGMYLKVEQCALLRPWRRGRSLVRRQTPRFEIAPSTGFWAEDDVWIDQAGHRAHLHVFAWHGVDDGPFTDQREPDQWQFFTVPTSSLPADRLHIGLDDLEELTDAVGYEDLWSRVDEIAAELRSRKAKK
ncbi:MAG: Arm DNA-binding domain-containing protein [Chloroflexi bacterium]|nr:Arm DNA-binding domain-containing protein [Chloroflexota bacterium]